MRALTAYVENAGLAYVFAVQCSFFVGRASAGMSERMKRGTNVMSEGMTALAWFFI